ncbi:alanine--tRNA ligase [bacterium]|nr:alanine--tRNA ligase [bacterium]
MLTAAEIRKLYVQFFVERDHRHVSSAPLVPPDDPTLMFTSAGMVQFKALYSGQVPLPYTRATTVQKCLRAGGKGSDLENVGKTLRHHTFFEMLGNFSFGDYFKREAITWAWEFCTGKKWLGLPADRIWPTIYGKKKNGDMIVDEEAREIWAKETGNVNPITLLDEKENFWGPAGETGACGPCSEIKFFIGTDEELKYYHDLAKKGDKASLAEIARDIVDKGDLFLEIWNLVFPQYDQQLDGSRKPLKNRGIDTGMGLERTTTSVQFIQSGGKVMTPYESDLLAPMVDAVSEITGLPYPAVHAEKSVLTALEARGMKPAEVRLAMNAIADHARALTFTLAEGLVPSNEGRGYVLRRILRRAARFGKKLGLSDPFIWRLVKPVIDVMGEAYPELLKHPDIIEKTIRLEEERFNRTLNQGSQLLDELLADIEPGGTLKGDDAYRLYETYGYPIDLTVETAEERGISVDVEGYDLALAEGKSRARASWKGGSGEAKWAELLADLGNKSKTQFVGYDVTEDEARVLAIIRDGQRVERLEQGQSGIIVLDRTPFYAESGGQIGDTGQILAVIDPENPPDPNLSAEDAQSKLVGEPLMNVEDTQKTTNGYTMHFGEAIDAIEVGRHVFAQVDEARRLATVANHSATHLMQAALKKVVGAHIPQQGSFVGPEGLRFDFTNPEPATAAQLRRVEELVNEMIRKIAPVRTAEMDLEEARRTGAIAPFGEKYGARVRVITMGQGDEVISREFCGGTHARATGQIGLFVITGESSVASGVRRIEALTGAAAVERALNERDMLNSLSRRMSAPADQVEDRLVSMQDELKQLRRQVEEVRAEKVREQAASAAGEARVIGDVKLVVQRMDGADLNALAQAWDATRQKSAEKTVGVFCSVLDDKVNMVVGVTADIAPARLKAPDIIREALAPLGGKGGGKPQMARGGAANPDKLDAVLAALPAIVERQLNK